MTSRRREAFTAREFRRWLRRYAAVVNASGRTMNPECEHLLPARKELVGGGGGASSLSPGIFMLQPSCECLARPFAKLVPLWQWRFGTRPKRLSASRLSAYVVQPPNGQITRASYALNVWRRVCLNSFKFPLSAGSVLDDLFVANRRRRPKVDAVLSADFRALDRAAALLTIEDFDGSLASPVASRLRWLYRCRFPGGNGWTREFPGLSGRGRMRCDSRWGRERLLTANTGAD